jgi:hypothetical protein
MRTIEMANPDKLYGIFGDAQWTNKDRLSDAMLRDLVEHFSSLELTVANLPEDELSQGYDGDQRHRHVHLARRPGRMEAPHPRQGRGGKAAGPVPRSGRPAQVRHRHGQAVDRFRRAHSSGDVSDKPLRDHNLLQAICRTNRPFGSEKTHGLIVDYIGIFDDVAQALAFDEKSVRLVVSNIDELRKVLPMKMGKCPVVLSRCGPHRFVELGERLERIKERHEQGLLTSLEFLEQMLELAKEVVEAEKETDPAEERDKAREALTELFQEAKSANTHIIVERIVADIDEIVKKVRFPDWQHSSAGERLVQKELRRTLLKYKLHSDQDLFDKAYSYIRQYY